MSIATTNPDNISQNRRLLQAGGTLNPKKHIYIQRPEDKEVLRLLLEGEYVNILTSRQMGKSSLMARAAYALQDEGVHFVSIDLAGELGSPDDAAVYYRGLLQKIARELRLPVDLKAWWLVHELETNNQKLLRFFKDEVGGVIEAPVVIFMDEIDSTLKLAFTDDLFTALRTMNNERTFEEAYQRITFCLLGVATPNELIKDRRTTPYNVGRTLELRDFDAERDNLTPLALALSPDLEKGQSLLTRVLHWTGGHPYLTNRLCHDLAKADVESPDQVNHHVDDVFRTLERVRDDVHVQQILRFVGDRFTKELESLNLYARILKGAQERDQPSLAHTELKLSGLVKRNDEGCLTVRNPIYARLFDYTWVKSTRPKRELARTRRLAAAASIAVGLLFGSGLLYQTLVVGPQQQALAVRQQLEELQIGIVQSENGNGLRIEFPGKANQALLEEVAALLAALSEEIVEIDLRPDYLEEDVNNISSLEPLSELTSLEVLDAAGTKATNLDPLKTLTQLRGLGLNHTEVTDLDPLRNLVGLEWLNLNDSRVENIDPLKTLTNLQRLGLNSAQVADVSPLKTLTNLQALILSDTQVLDVSALKGLTNLEMLDLSVTLISDVSALGDLINLHTLDLSITQVADIGELEDLTNLQTLNLVFTQVEDVSALKNLTNLRTLDLWHTQVADVSVLNNLSNLQKLSLSGTKVSDVTSLKGLTDLQNLHLSETQVADLSALKDLNNLQELHLNNSDVADLSALKDLNNLQELYLNKSPVADLSGLKDLNNLRVLHLSETQVADVSALKDLINLRELNLNASRVVDIGPLNGLTNLQWLYLRDTYVSDIMPLAALSALKRLDIVNTRVSDRALDAFSEASTATGLSIDRFQQPDDSVSQ